MNFKKGKLLWITGLSGSGKSTLANAVYRILKEENDSIVLLDGDQFREIIESYGYKREDRVKVGMQIVKLCNTLVNQGISVVCATISLFKEIHNFNTKNTSNLIEVVVHCEMEELIKRNQKGIYQKAIAGLMENVVGIDIPYELPLSPALTVDNTTDENLEETINQIITLYNNYETR